MMDMFDRPVVWGETVADDATPVATAGNGANLPETSREAASVAPVASVAQMQVEAGRAIAAKVAAARRSAHDVASVAGVAETAGERLERMLSQSSVAVRATDGATEESEVSRGVSPNLGAGVAPVATVAAWRDQVELVRKARPAPKPYHAKWRVLRQDVLDFMALWADDAARMGWDTLDVFGVNPDPSHGRYDRLGLLILLNGRPIQCLDEQAAYIGRDSAPTVYRRALRAPGGVPVWQWLEGGAQ